MPTRLFLMPLVARRSEHADFLTCPRCATQMAKVVTIAPIGRQPGLVAYECPKCAYVTSVLAFSATSHPTAR
jgi:transposase-like protein